MIKLFFIRTTVTIAMAIVSAGGAQAEDQRGAEIESKDRQLNTFIVTHDTSAAAKLYADDFVLTTSSGKVKTKTDILREIGLTTLTFEINSTSKVEVRLHADTAVLTGTLHQKGRIKDTSFDTTLLVTDTWIRDDAHGWRLLAGHATSISP